ncbi:MAG: glycosyltransferase family 2 protein [Moorellaceae bacterium]
MADRGRQDPELTLFAQAGHIINYFRNILIIVPAYNEEKTVASVVWHIREQGPFDVLVVDDGSTDRTTEEATAAGARVVSLPFNLGIGGAVQTGYLYALRYGYSIAVQLDADGQHDPRSLHRLLEPVVSDRADIAVGSRFLGGPRYSVPLTRRIGIRLFALMLSWLWQQPVTDPTSGFRAVNRRVMKTFAGYYPDDYPEVEALAHLRYLGVRLVEVPVTMHPRQEGRSSITPARAAYYMVKVFLAIIKALLSRGSMTPIKAYRTKTTNRTG